MPEKLRKALPDIEELKKLLYTNTARQVIYTAPKLSANSPYANRPATAGRGW